MLGLNHIYIDSVLVGMPCRGIEAIPSVHTHKVSVPSDLDRCGNELLCRVPAYGWSWCCLYQLCGLTSVLCRKVVQWCITPNTPGHHLLTESEKRLQAPAIVNRVMAHALNGLVNVEVGYLGQDRCGSYQDRGTELSTHAPCSEVECRSV